MSEEGRRSPSGRWAVLAVLGSLTGCQCAQLPEAVFACEPDGTCAQSGYVCGPDLLCRPDDAGVDAGLDAGSTGDAGVDAGTDAGLDSGVDAGLDAGVDAGLDASVDAGLDAGIDAGHDAGIDAGHDAGTDAGCLTYDLPDDSFTDSNCDGIDGERNNAAFVSTTGSDAGDGSMANPFRTIAQALASGKPQVLVANGTYVENLSFGSGRVWGGYDSSAGWARSLTQATLTGSVVVDGDGGFITLDSLDIEAPAATGTGASSVALTIRNVGQGEGAVLNRLRLVASQGADGANGSNGTAGVGGLEGPAGASGPDGGLGGPGASAQTCPDGISQAGWPGGDGARALPGDGADGGDETLGGAGGRAVTCLGPPCSGADGGAGLLATDSLAGSAGAAGSERGQIVGLSWLPTLGGTGATGGRGRGGGGGGGGGGFFDQLAAFFGFGGGGGGGGSGGCGGLGGSGGQGGGASIALLLINASPSLSQVTLVPGHGGTGGTGAPGGPGGPGGVGGPGGEGELVDDAGVTGGGGAGAPGRAGGMGGQGGPGAGGPGVGLWCEGTTNPLETNVSVSAGVGGMAGQPNGVSGLSRTTFGCP